MPETSQARHFPPRRWLPAEKTEPAERPASEEGAPAVSVILPTFNRAEFIGEALASLLTQTAPAAEIVVVDDGSTDGTRAVVEQFAGRVEYVHQPNAGKLAAIANGLDRTTAGLVLIMDDDDILADGALAALAAPFAADPDCVFAYGRMERFEMKNGRRVRRGAPDYPVSDDRPFYVKLMEDCFITGHPCVLVRREALEAMRPFDSKVIASVDYYLHLGVARQGETAFVDDVVLYQRQHTGLRGPSHARYGEADRNRRWIEHDAYLFGQLLEELALPEYLGIRDPDGTAALTPALRRRALLQKGTIAGRKKLWPQALEAFREGFAIESRRPLDPDERRVLEGCLGSRYGIEEIHADPTILDRLQRLARTRPDGDRILSALSRPLLHQMKLAARRGDHKLALETVRAWFRLMDMNASGTAIAASVRRNLRRALPRAG